MKVLKDTLAIEIDVWSDPGDYPNALAAGPLPDRDYVAGVEGEVVVELTPEDLAEYRECPEDWLSDLDIPRPDGVSSMTWVVDKIEDGPPIIMTLHAEDVEGDTGWEPEYDPVDDYERRLRREELL